MIKGIDVSTYQGYPNWNKVKADGVEFAMIKATQGQAESSSSYLFTDSKFKYNITNASAVGIRCGVYHYLTANTISEAIAEAKYFVETIKPYQNQITLYAAVDVESTLLNNLTKGELTNIVTKFCEVVEGNDFVSIVYTNPNWLKTRLNGVGLNYLWLALWRNKLLKPAGYPNMAIWQWGLSKVNGISGSVDSNIGYFATDSKIKPLVPEQIVSSNRDSIKTGDIVRVENPINYDSGKTFKLYYNTYEVMQVVGKRAVIGVNGKVTSAIHVNYIEKV